MLWNFCSHSTFSLLEGAKEGVGDYVSDQMARYGNRRGVQRVGRVLPEMISYKNPTLLSGLISERGKIMPVRVTSLPRGMQSVFSKAVKRARYLALLRFPVD